MGFEMILQKKHAVKVLTAILIQVFTDHGHKFPAKFEDFALEIAKRLWAQFKIIEGNQVIFERYIDQEDNIDQLTLKVRHQFELSENKVHIGV